MASKSIDIKIGSTFSADGVLAANKGLAQLAQDVKSANAEMQKATMRAEMSVNSYAENADRAVRAMGGGYKTLEQQLAELGKSHESVGATATAAGASATKSAVGLEMAMGLARGSTEQTAKAFAMLTQKIPLLGKLGVAACGAWAAAITSVIKLISSTKDLIVTAFNLDAVPKEVTEASSAMVDLANAAEQFKFAMDEAREASKTQLKTFEAEADALNKVAKAQIELNRQRALAGVKSDYERAEINAAAESESSASDEETAQTKRDARRQALNDELSRLWAEDRESKKTMAVAKENFGKGVDADVAYLDARDAIEANEKKRAKTYASLDLLDKEDEAASIASEARHQREANAAAELARKKLEEEKKLADEKAKADADAAKKVEADRLAAVEAERKAREKMEADLHAQRVANAKAELQSSEQTASAVSNTASRAETEFDRAFGMYRSEDHGAAQIAEERDYAADYKQLHKDAERYGGKWRIDELASLMAAGDTKGQAAKLEEWRKSSSFTPEVESMVRAAAADQTKTTAEDELRKINENTKNLADKLDQLLQVK